MAACALSDALRPYDRRMSSGRNSTHAAIVRYGFRDSQAVACSAFIASATLKVLTPHSSPELNGSHACLMTKPGAATEVYAA